MPFLEEIIITPDVPRFSNDGRTIYAYYEFLRDHCGYRGRNEPGKVLRFSKPLEYTNSNLWSRVTNIGIHNLVNPKHKVLVIVCCEE